MICVVDSSGALLGPELTGFLGRLQPPEDETLQNLARATADVGLSEPEQQVGRLLSLLARASGAGRIFEVGTGAGYYTLYMARGAPEARITTVEPDPARREVARRHLEATGATIVEAAGRAAGGTVGAVAQEVAGEAPGRTAGEAARRTAGVPGEIELLGGDPVEEVAGLTGPLDLVCLDAGRGRTRRLLDLTLPRLRVGGLVAVLGLLAGGRLLDPAVVEERELRELEGFCGYLTVHPQLASVVLPIGGGVGLAAKTRRLITELGGPF